MTYIIAEIGQNHNGSVDLAQKIIDFLIVPVWDDHFNCKLPGIDAIKLCKRDLDNEMAKSAGSLPYDNVNSFGETYDKHRANLELSALEHFKLYRYAKNYDLHVIETFCSASAMESILYFFTPDRIKVASRDLTNLPLIEEIAKTKIPIILSTGMSGLKQLEQALNIITGYHSQISILHCLSQYPSEYQNINLLTIQYLIEQYPDYTIGYSDHSIGITVPVAAVALGARIIEKHITFEREFKGTDHSGALGIEGVARMIRDIRNIEKAMGEKQMFAHPAADQARQKLERSIAARHIIHKGEIIREDDLCMLSPGTGYKWSDRGEVVGRSASKDIPEKEIIYSYMIN